MQACISVQTFLDKFGFFKINQLSAEIGISNPRIFNQANDLIKHQHLKQTVSMAPRLTQAFIYYFIPNPRYGLFLLCLLLLICSHNCEPIILDKQTTMISVQSKQCPHFHTYKLAKAVFLPTHPECKRCGVGKDNLWLCLAKDCEELHCGRRSFEHLILHLEQSKKKKQFHTVFINILTAQIYCVSCQLMIEDHQEQGKPGWVTAVSNTAFKLRTKVLPFLATFSDFQISGQVENSQAHRKINRGSVGIFSNQYNYTIHAAVQFISQCSYFRDIVLSLRVDKCHPSLYELKEVIMQLDEARYRVIHANKLDETVYQQKPHLQTYQRKDPLQIVLFFLQLLHQYLHFYTLVDSRAGQDEWDVFHSKGHLRMICPIYGSIQIQLKLNYYCNKCKHHQFYLKTINYLKLVLQKKKRNVKDVQKELNEHRADSPLKKRKSSLANFFFKEEEMPITVQELIIDLMRKPLHKQKLCEKCKEPLKKNKIQFQSLPNYLIIQVCRMSPEGYGIDDTSVNFSAADIDFGAFTVDKDRTQLYAFEAAIGIEKKGFFPVMARNPYNKMLQAFRNEHISFEDKLNPYIICYKKLPSVSSTEKYVSTVKHTQNEHQRYILPDFWDIQMKHNFEHSLINPFICKHSMLKPELHSKQINQLLLTMQNYERICYQYYGRTYRPVQCGQCLQEFHKIQSRRKRQREAIKKYDSVKTEVHCMISIQWINKWSAFLYKKGNLNYFSKGYPPPGRIDNSTILEGKKCKPCLVNNRDFKVVNVYIWRFLKQLYGGGTEIRYKWKKECTSLINEELVQSARAQAAQLKGLLVQLPQLSLSKKSTTMEQSSYISEDQYEPSKNEEDK